LLLALRNRPTFPSQEAIPEIPAQNVFPVCSRGTLRAPGTSLDGAPIVLALQLQLRVVQPPPGLGVEQIVFANPVTELVSFEKSELVPTFRFALVPL